MQGDRQFEIARMRENFIVESSTKRVILSSYLSPIVFFNTFQCKDWVGGHIACLLASPINECKLPFIRKYSVNLRFHLTALLRAAVNMRLQSKMTNVVLPSSF